MQGCKSQAWKSGLDWAGQAKIFRRTFITLLSRTPNVHTYEQSYYNDEAQNKKKIGFYI